MIRLNYNIANEMSEFDLVAQSKQLPSRVNLIALRPLVDINYIEYLNSFNSIHNKGVSTFNPFSANELKNCYDNPTGALNNLKVRLVNSQSDTFKFLCPYCLIMNHSTFDHYIPKEVYPVYSICAKNLIPCCILCNGKKLQYWKENGQRAILHFYNDLIPNERFLFCDLTFNASIPILKFRLLFPHNFDVSVRFRIEKHFDRLGLIERYDESVPMVLSNIDTDIDAVGNFAPTINELRIFLTQKAGSLSNKCGNNYWQAIAYQTLANSNIYLNSLIA